MPFDLLLVASLGLLAFAVGAWLRAFFKESPPALDRIRN